MANSTRQKAKAVGGVSEAKLQALHLARNYPAMIPLLEQLVREDIGKTRLWKYRGYFRDLPPELAENSPTICYGLALLAVLSDDIATADEYVALLQKKQTAYRSTSAEYKQIESCLRYMEIALPHRSSHGTFGAIVALVSIVREQGGRDSPLSLSLSLTVNLPSIMNGGRDFWDYSRYVPKIRGVLKGIAKILYGKLGVGMADIATAEILYQQDRVYEALVLVVSAMPFIEREGDVSILFAAMYLQFCILLVNGQVDSARPMIKTMREKILAAGADYLIPNLNAHAAWAAMYDGDRELISSWLRTQAPDEFGEFCTADRFCYFVKLRVYLLYGKHLSVVALCERMRPALRSQNRKMDLCRLDMLLAISHFDAGSRQKAFELMRTALELGEKYRFDRLFANEGERMYFLLRAYADEMGESPYLNRVIVLARKMALAFPHYLQKRQESVEPLTDSELAVLQLMAAGRSNAQIGEFMQITVNTVKFHSKNLFSKLDANTRAQAVQTAREHGII